VARSDRPSCGSKRTESSGPRPTLEARFTEEAAPGTSRSTCRAAVALPALAEERLGLGREGDQAAGDRPARRLLVVAVVLQAGPQAQVGRPPGRPVEPIASPGPPAEDLVVEPGVHGPGQELGRVAGVVISVEEVIVEANIGELVDL